MRFDPSLPLLFVLALGALALAEPSHSRSLEAAVPPVPADSTRPVYVFASGLRVALPEGWDGPPLADESRLPGYAVYAFRPAGDDPLWAGVTLRVERIVGLNPIQEQQFRRGQTSYGYAGTHPVATAETPLPALAAYAVEGERVRGVVAFLQAGRTFWAVAVTAPPGLWDARRAELLGLLRGVTLP